MPRVPGPPYLPLYLGQVVRNDDPLGMGRVEVICPAVMGDLTLDWAVPLSGLGAGPSVGVVAIPPVGALVGILFLVGDENFPYYLPGWWPNPKGNSEIPTPPATTKSTTPLAQAQKAGDPNNKLWETEKWRLWFRDKVGEQRVRIESKDDSDQFIEIDGNTGDITIAVKTAKQLLLGDINASEQLILGNAFATIYNSHTHTYIPGALPPVQSGPPSAPITVAQLSSKVKAAT